ncbi:MAG: hypothetical protein IJM51_01890 [Clostridia bacterium]|nr:hypothetical protein [Clostridia bacterium]
MMTLLNESQCSYTCAVGLDMLNGGGFMKPYGYQALIMDVAERHLRQFRLGVDDLLRQGMSWVLVSSSVEIIQPIREEMTLTARTWHSEQDRLTFRRELRFSDTQGHPLFHAATFSVLMDVRERKILRPDRLACSIGEPHSEFLLEASPKLRFTGEMTPCDRRKVYPSCIDRLGHTNNCRYPEFAYDALNEEEIAALGSLRRMDICFKSELKQGEFFTVRRSAPDFREGGLVIDGIHDDSGKQSFIVRFEVS